jgi:hypothetical protein
MVADKVSPLTNFRNRRPGFQGFNKWGSLFLGKEQMLIDNKVEQHLHLVSIPEVFR